MTQSILLPLDMRMRRQPGNHKVPGVEDIFVKGCTCFTVGYRAIAVRQGSASLYSEETSPQTGDLYLRLWVLEPDRELPWQRAQVNDLNPPLLVQMAGGTPVGIEWIAPETFMSPIRAGMDADPVNN